MTNDPDLIGADTYWHTVYGNIVPDVVPAVRPRLYTRSQNLAWVLYEYRRAFYLWFRGSPRGVYGYRGVDQYW